MPGFPEDEASKEALYTATRYLEMPLADAVAEIEIVLNEAHDNIMLGNVTVDEGIADMNTRVQEIIAAQ
ncbi:MAG: sugar ABC transporter substrate-binding protein, partial [Clostridiales bacterium]|jgi:multiple sugar transport system substrate-binding protein|nr:sugar ABC transporter substrate-binding protein [Clostridiales bacterium]